MNEDKSWSLGEDFEQGYEELSAFVITIPKMPSSHHSQQSVFKGVKAYFNPDFVSDILCPGPSGDLTTILTDDDTTSTMYDFHDFGLIFAGQMHCLPQRLKSTLFEIFSNGGCLKGTRSVEKGFK